MRKQALVRIFVLTAAVAALSVAYEKASTEKNMETAATRFLSSLDQAGKAKAQRDFSTDGREKWHFVPDSNFQSTYGYGRNGLTYKMMTPQQRSLANALLSSGLSGDGLLKALSIMSQEEILRVKENAPEGRRDVEKYYFTVFGKPSMSGNWGWRVEGHHVSLHYTLRNGKMVSASPTFFGANPHKIEGGFRSLGAEEDLGRDLVLSLNAKQRKTAIVADVAYSDILTKADSRAKLEDQPRGLAASEMSAKQRQTLTALIEQYVANVPGSVAAERRKAVRATKQGDLLFAWAGATEPGKGDYYRVQAPTFLIEYDNTQGGANHSHTVWRDFEGDFGRDVLALHYEFDDHGLRKQRPLAAD
jgi:hypothetical protein